MIELPVSRLASLRDRLKAQGNRPSMILPMASPDVAESVALVEEYGPMCEAMFLMMAADRKMRNVERQVLRGALDVISEGAVRTVHMEAMLDSAARRLARDGAERRIAYVVQELQSDPVRAEMTLVLAAAVAAADGEIVPAEHELFGRLADGLGVTEERAKQILAELTAPTT